MAVGVASVVTWPRRLLHQSAVTTLFREKTLSSSQLTWILAMTHLRQVSTVEECSQSMATAANFGGGAASTY